MVFWAGVCGTSGDEETDDMGFTAEQRMGDEKGFGYRGRKLNKEEEKKMEERTFNIAGVQFHDMKKVIGDLEEGIELDLTPEPDNQYDPNAVRIEHKGTMLGYVPRKFSSEISAVLDAGIDAHCFIVKLNPTAKPWEQCQVSIKEVE